MPRFTALARRRTLVLAAVAALATAAACADEAATTAPSAAPTRPNLAVGDFIVVTNASGGSGTGSLRWAAAQAKDGEIVRFYPSLAGQTITLEGPIEVPYAITIEGPADRGVTISGGGQVQAFDIRNVGTTTLRNLTITGGRPASGSSGGGIHHESGRLVLENTTVTGNQAGAAGAIYARELTLVNSTVSSNTSTAQGFPYPAVMATRLTLVNSTVAFNAPRGVNASAAIELRNALLTANGTANCVFDPGTAVTRAGANVSSDASCGDGSVMIVADPQLDALRDNGGPTMTHAIPQTSPAVNAGAACSVTTDQRYRPRDAQCDLGAFELTGVATVKLTVDGKVAFDPSSGAATVTGTLQCSQPARFDLDVVLRQDARDGGAPVQADGTTPAVCGTSSAAWRVTFTPAGGAFAKGGAFAAASMNNRPAWVSPTSVSRDVKLAASRK